MNRQILFRGKRVDNGKWVEGFLWSEHTIGYTSPIGNTDEIVIDPETVGQYTGLTDKNGKRIFEGDIVKVKYTFNGEDCEEIKPVTYDPKNGGYVPFTWEYQCDGCDCEVTIIETEVISNIHDNKEFDAQNGEEKEE